MIYNCAKVVNDYGEAVGYLCVTNISGNQLLGCNWKYYDMDDYDQLLDEHSYAEVFLHLSDIDVFQYKLIDAEDPIVTQNVSYTYLILEESLYRKVAHKADRVLLVPHAVFTKRKNCLVTVAAIGSGCHNLAVKMNRWYPTIEQNLCDSASSIYRFVLSVKDFNRTDIFSLSLLSTLSIVRQIESPYWGTSVKGWLPASEEYCRDLLHTWDSYTDTYILPDLSDYPNITSYQSLMGFDAERMAEMLPILFNTYGVNNLGELNISLSHVV